MCKFKKTYKTRQNFLMMVSIQSTYYPKHYTSNQNKMIHLNNLKSSETSRKYSNIRKKFISSNSNGQQIKGKLDSKRTNDYKINNFRANNSNDSIGHDAGYVGPFGWKKYIYVDHTASGKAVESIENFIKFEVLPHYANTHTTVSNTSLQTTVFRNEARDIIHKAVGGMENDEVIFCGSGATSAVHKLLHSISYPKSRKLIVFVGPFEHHSNILPWREAASKVIEVPMNPKSGQVDTVFLRNNLKKWSTRWLDRKNRLVVGCFSAGSNVTGVVTDDVEITELLHEFGALSFWDYAAAAPHVQINMNPKCNRNKGTDASKDALFFSGHKLLGGPQTPGVLVVKKHVLQNPVPHAMGGGTVMLVTRQAHLYLDTIHDREEGGTPDIVGSIRLGLVFLLRDTVGIQNIVELESQFCRRMLYEWAKLPEIQILGSKDNIRLPCISFLIEHLETGYFLHHSFVVALLNDLFGIQCRGGCMCAGPYALTLLGIDDKLSSLFETSLKTDRGLASLMKTGFVRISLSYHSSAEEIEFVIEAVKLIAKYGWKLLPLYRIDKKSGSFVFKGGFKPTVTSLYSFHDTRLPPSHTVLNSIDPSGIFDPIQILKEAEHFMATISHINNYLFSNFLKEPDRLKKLRWFMLPSESLFLQCYDHPPNLIESARPFTPITVKTHDDIDSLGFIDRNNNPGHTFGTTGKKTEGPWRKGSVPYQIYRVWKTRKNDQGKDVERRMIYSSGFEENIYT